MATSNLGQKTHSINTSLDDIVIVNALGDIPGGRTLDVTGISDEVIVAGRVIVKTSAGEYKPLAITSGAYATPATGETYVGIVKASVLATDPRAAIVTIGQVNADAAATATGAPYTDAIKNGLPRIQFI